MVPGQRSEGLNELRIREPRAMPAVDGRQRRPLRRQSGHPDCSGAFAQTTAAKRLTSEFSAGHLSEAAWPKVARWRMFEMSGACSGNSSRTQQTPEALKAFHKAEIEKWWPIIEAAAISAE